MKLHKNKTQKKQAQQARRKVRTNATTKAQHYDARVVVRRSLLHVSAQVIAPNGDVLASVSDKSVKGDTKTDRAFAAGQALAALIKKAKADKVIFDRNGYLYHGRIKAFAEGIRDGGIAL